MSNKPLKFPLELYDHPSIRSLNLCQSGLFRILIEKYWISGIPLPKNDYALIRLSNADYRTYKKYKHKVIEALNITMPAFIEARSIQSHNRITQQKNAYNMVAKRINKGNGNKKIFSDKVDTYSENTAIPSPRKNWNEGRFDHVEREKALKNTDKDAGFIFSDKVE